MDQELLGTTVASIHVWLRYTVMTSAIELDHLPVPDGVNELLIHVFHISAQQILADTSWTDSSIVMHKMQYDTSDVKTKR